MTKLRGMKSGGANISASPRHPPLNSVPWSPAEASLDSPSRVPLNEGAPRHGDRSVRSAESLASAGPGDRLPAAAADRPGAPPLGGAGGAGAGVDAPARAGKAGRGQA